jgi:hypothetical protein
MADQDSAAAATVVNPTPSQPAASVPDESQQLIKRLQEQVRGGQAYYQTGSQFGLKTADDIKKAGALYQSIVSSGIDPETVVQSLKAPAPSQETHHVTAPAFDKDAFAQTVLNALDQREAARRAEESHKTQFAAESSILSKVVGSAEGLTAKERKIVERAVKGAVNDLRQDYPVGHPLYGVALQPADEALFQTALKSVLNEMNAEAGQDMANKADSAIAGLGRTPTAGNNGGLATPIAATSGPRRPFNPLNATPEQKQAWLAEAELATKAGRI